MPTTVDPTENASLCVKNFTSVKNATKSCRTKNGSPRENCVGIVKEILDPNEHRCYMKPIVNQEEDSGEAR